MQRDDAFAGWRLRLAEMASEIEHRSATTWGQRWGEVRRSWVLILQVCIGSGLAWTVASDVVGHAQPFFAPVAAAVTMAAGQGRRRVVAIELVIGVSIGVFGGELLIAQIGRGAWQLVLVVALALTLTSFLRMGGIGRLQSVTSAILIATVNPVTGTSGVTVAVNRFLDALVGGVVGFLITLVLPANPLRTIEREIDVLLTQVSTALDKLATALQRLEPEGAREALQRVRDLQPRLTELSSMLDSADEVSRLSPLR
ncbi:MAG: FUSC family protein, partial [Nocardioidaceae bacterium]